jgi:hypothetical protein
MEPNMNLRKIGATALWCCVIFTVWIPIAAQTMTKALVAEKIRRVEDGVDEFRIILGVLEISVIGYIECLAAKLHIESLVNSEVSLKPDVDGEKPGARLLTQEQILCSQRRSSSLLRR